LIERSIAGYVGLMKKVVNIEDVYNKGELKRISASLTFSYEGDKRTGYRTKQMLVAPILNADTQELIGVVQAINHKSDQPFTITAVEAIIEICQALAIALKQRQKPCQLLKSTSDYMIFDAVISAVEF